MSVLSTVAIALAVIALVALLPRRLPKGAHIAPGPLRLPGLGAPGLLYHRMKRLDWIWAQIRQYGPTISSGLPGKPVVVTTSPECVEHVLKTNFANYVKGEFFFTRFEELLGRGIFNIDGADWKVQRKTFSKLFSTNALKAMVPVFTKHADSVVALLDGYAESGEAFDLQDVFYRFTLDSVGEIAFGVNVDSLHQETPFAVAFDRANNASTARFVSPGWSVRRFFNVGAERQLKKDIAVLNEFAAETIAARRADPTVGERTDVLSRFLRLVDEQGRPFSDGFLRDVILNWLIAGRDTTAQALSWLSYELMRRPEAADRLAAEVARETIGGSVTTYEAVSNLEYTSACINEGLRLHPSVPMDPKSAVADDVLPDGTFVAAGSFVVYAPWIMGRLPALWGDDCMEFKPERFVGGEQPSPFKFTAFQAGPRTCLGITMAPLEMRVVLAKVMARFRFELEPGQDITYALTATLAMKNGMRVKCYRR